MSSFLADPSVRTALVVGALVAAVSGPVGVFAVLRSQSFAGHAMADIGAAGGAGGLLAGVNLLWGFVASNVLAAGTMQALDRRRRRSGDLATGIVLGASLGLAALFLHIETERSTSGATVRVLFGSLFLVPRSTVVPVAVLGTLCLVTLVLLYRPLLLSSVSAELASARRLPVRLLAAVYLVVLSLAVSLSAVSIGAILSTALLIGPAATAVRLVRQPGAAMVLAAAVGVTATWAGVLLSYLSYRWPPAHRGWPVSFFVVAAVLVLYGSARLVRD